MAKTKTKDYMLRAHNNYVHKKDRMTVLAPAGTIDKIKQAEGVDVSLNAYIYRLIDADLKKRMQYRDWETSTPDRKSTRLNSSHEIPYRMPSSA